MIAILAAFALLALYDWACRMDWGTPHGVRAACIVLALGCAALLLGESDIGVTLLLLGVVVFRVFDRRRKRHEP